MIFTIYHYAFATDDVKQTFSLVEADTKEEALHKYNNLAQSRSEYPYMWNQAKIENVFVSEIIK